MKDIQILKIFFYNNYRKLHDLIMNFSLNNFQFKNDKFLMELTDSVFISLRETPLSHIRHLSHNRGLSSI